MFSITNVAQLEQWGLGFGSVCEFIGPSQFHSRDVWCDSNLVKCVGFIGEAKGTLISFQLSCSFGQVQVAAVVHSFRPDLFSFLFCPIRHRI